MNIKPCMCLLIPSSPGGDNLTGFGIGSCRTKSAHKSACSSICATGNLTPHVVQWTKRETSCLHSCTPQKRWLSPTVEHDRPSDCSTVFTSDLELFLSKNNRLICVLVSKSDSTICWTVLHDIAHWPYKEGYLGTTKTRFFFIPLNRERFARTCPWNNFYLTTVVCGLFNIERWFASRALEPLTECGVFRNSRLCDRISRCI